MHPAAKIAMPSPADVLGRLFWLGLVVIHAAPLARTAAAVAAGPDVAGLLKAGSLLLSIAFFASKVAGVRYLPEGKRIHAILVFLILSGLVHPRTRDQLAPVAAEPVAILAFATAGAALLGRRRVLRRLMSRLAATGPKLLSSPHWSTLLLGKVALPLAPLPPCAYPRGPPSF